MKKYSVKRMLPKVIDDPKHPGKKLTTGFYATIKTGLTWQEAKELKRKEPALSIVPE